MTSRYEILDILSQDGHGVCFHAEDSETGREVALRRFFPFGPDGGGLEEEERAAYDIGVKRLKEVSHPALRSVLDGGTDPVDGMPFLVTEWVEGQQLSDHLAAGPLEPSSVRSLADLALETSLILSEAFGEEAIWVETDPTTVIVSEQDPARQITYWISPLRWLGDPDARSDLKPLLEMVEQLCGWKGQIISRGSGRGLGAWVNTLRDHPDTWTLAQAKEALHEPATLVEASAAQATQSPPTPSPQIAQQPTQVSPPQQVVFVNRTVIWPWVLASVLSLTAAGLVFWKKNTPDPPAPGTQVAALESPDEPIGDGSPTTPTLAQGAGSTSGPGRESDDSSSTGSPVKAPEPTRDHSASQESALEALNRRAAEMAAQAEANALVVMGEKATIEGTITSTESSKSGKSHYLKFTTSKGGQTLWAMFRTADWDDFDLSTLEDLEGKQARITGRWNPESSYRKTVLRMSATRQLEILD